MSWTYFHESSIDSECCGDVDSVCDLIAGGYGVPIECQQCYKALLFWDGFINVRQFKKLLAEIPTVGGKYNDGVAVFYFQQKGTMLLFLGVLSDLLQQFGVVGHVQWRVSCRVIQDRFPELFISTKELVPRDDHATFQELQILADDDVADEHQLSIDGGDFSDVRPEDLVCYKRMDKQIRDMLCDRR